jgi:dTDP-4-dehydrorhamnose 3,5-epimerase-like enzyme
LGEIVIAFDLFKNDSGSLVFMEGNREIPFVVKRVFYVYDVAKNARRAMHALKTTEQVIICLQGSCVCSIDNGSSREEIKLDNPRTGVHLRKGIWREIKDISPDCIILGLADREYDPNDYIRDYNEFLKFSKGETKPGD